MTEEQMRLAIAEACGWKPDKRGLGWLNPHGYYAPEPDYLNDLNAMHEAETSLTDEHWDDYAAHLGLWDDDPYRAAKALHATARQRCIAYLKTKGILP